ncbi:UNVERIFIED_ORG: LysR family transcriptional regulator [Martelella mediterranea]
MTETDLNLLRALGALLDTGSVTGAAARLGLSVSAMSRTLTRLRTATGDPLFVRAGSRLVPTPHATALATRVPDLLVQVEAALAPEEGGLDLTTLDRTFSLRANEGFIHRFGAALIPAMLRAAPLTRLRLAPKTIKDATPLREGAVDLEIGVLGEFAPEIRTRRLFEDQFIAAVRPGHPLLEGPVTPESFARALHVVASRRGQLAGPVDEALADMGLSRRVAAVVPGFPDAMEIARRSDLVAQIPRSVLSPDLVGIDLPVPVPGISVSAMWHPRFDVDPEQKWFRATVFETVHTVEAAGH